MKILKKQEYKKLLETIDQLSNEVKDLKTFREVNKSEIDRLQRIEDSFTNVFNYNETIAIKGGKE